ncbi:GPR1/FUN34/yaaH family-domain-containing protein, partial [Blyttiomyces helicus]
AGSDLDNGLGIYLLAWAIFTFLMLVAAHRISVAHIILFASLFITFMLLAFGKFNSDLNLQKAGGGFGLFTAFVAWYIALSELLTKETSLFQLPIGRLNKRQ